MFARLLLIYWPRVSYQLLLGLLQQLLRVLPMAEDTHTPPQRALDFAGLPPGHTEWWRAGPMRERFGESAPFQQA